MDGDGDGDGDDDGDDDDDDDDDDVDDEDEDEDEEEEEGEGEDCHDRPRTWDLFASLRSRNACKDFTSATWYRKLPEKCRGPD